MADSQEVDDAFEALLLSQAELGLGDGDGGSAPQLGPSAAQHSIQHSSGSSSAAASDEVDEAFRDVSEFLLSQDPGPAQGQHASPD